MPSAKNQKLLAMATFKKDTWILRTGLSPRFWTQGCYLTMNNELV